jgi:hypothetical protein
MYAARKAALERLFQNIAEAGRRIAGMFGRSAGVSPAWLT